MKKVARVLIGYFNQHRRKTIYREFVRAVIKVVPIIFSGFVTLSFGYLLYFFGAKSDALNQRRYDFNKYRVESKNSLIIDFSKLANNRYLQSQRLLATPCNSPSINTAWNMYDTSVIDWNQNNDIISGRFKTYFGTTTAILIQDIAEDPYSEKIPDSLHYKFVALHNILLNHKNCEVTAKEIDRAKKISDSIAQQKKNIILSAYIITDNEQANLNKYLK
jgi:hypothetical protein